MRTSRTAAGRALSALVVAALAAGLVAALGGARLPAAVHALLAPAVATPGSAAARRPPAGVATAGDRPATPTPDAQARVDVAISALVAGRPAGSVSVAVLDTTTARRLGWGAESRMTAASVFKLLLLEGWLLHDQDLGRPPGDGDADALTAMVENSDNDAADQVFGALGGSAGVTSVLHRLGLTATVLGAADQWGLSTTTATDQLVALTDLVAPQGPLSTASEAYALGLMSDVEPDQRWGVAAAADPGTDVANKNGWLDLDADGGRWVASSVGVLQIGGHRVLLAVLTQHDTDLADGIGLVQAVSRAVASSLRTSS